MKPRFTKTIRNALILSVAIHMILILILRAIYQIAPAPTEDVTQVEIRKIKPQRSLRPLKLKSYIPPELTQVQQKKAQVQVEVVRPVPLQPAAAPFVHRNPVVPFRGAALRTPRTLEHSKSGVGSAGSIGGSQVGNRRSVGSLAPRGTSGSATYQFVKPPAQELLPDIGEMMLPDMTLARIGQHILATRTTNMVDVVFVIDASGSMKDNISAVRNYLNRMTELFDNAKLDFTLGIVIFRDSTTYSMLGWDFEVVPQTRSVSLIKRSLAQVKCRGGEKAMDALIRAADEVKFRQDAEIHFILVTDEYVSGAYSSTDVMLKMKTSKIKVDVIGRDEPFQKFIAKSTGGLWLPISSLAVQ